MASSIVITGHNEAEMAASRAAAKLQIAFYASTPAYRGILELHGWDFGPELTARSRRGDWLSMGEVVPDDVVDEVCVTAPLGELGAAVRAKYQGSVDRLGFYFSDAILPEYPPVFTLTDEEWASLVAGVHG